LVWAFSSNPSLTSVSGSNPFKTREKRKNKTRESKKDKGREVNTIGGGKKAFQKRTRVGLTFM